MTQCTVIDDLWKIQTQTPPGSALRAKVLGPGALGAAAGNRQLLLEIRHLKFKRQLTLKPQLTHLLFQKSS